MAVALNHLGRMLILEGSYAQAQGLYQENITIYRDIGDRGGLAAALDGLGKVTVALGDYASAERCYFQALQVAGTEIIHTTFSVLSGLAYLWLLMGHPMRGVELLALLLYHPGGHDEVKRQVEEILSRYEAELPPDLLAAALGCGKKLDLEAVVAQMLAEYEINT